MLDSRSRINAVAVHLLVLELSLLLLFPAHPDAALDSNVSVTIFPRRQLRFETHLLARRERSPKIQKGLHGVESLIPRYIFGETLRILDKFAVLFREIYPPS